MHDRLNTEESARPLNSTRSRTHLVNDDIKGEIEQEEKIKGKMTEKITFSKLVIFVIYIVCLINSALAMQNIEETSANNISLKETLSNMIDNGTDFLVIEDSKISFDQLSTMQDVYSWFKDVFINVIYNSDLSFQSFGYVPTGNSVLYFQIMGPLRFKINRAIHVHLPNSSVYPHRWLDEGETYDRKPYGQNGEFEYDEAEGGYTQSLPITYMGKDEVFYNLNMLHQLGFFDSFLKTLDIDTVVFNKVNNYWSFIQAQFEFSAAGAIKYKKLKIFSYPSDAYYPISSAQESLIVYQVLFLLMFCYYFFQEFLKLYVQIKNALLSNKPSGVVSVEQAAKMARKKVEAVLKGILNHLKEPLTFVNVLSITFSFYLIYQWMDYVYNSQLLPDLEKLKMKDGVITHLTEEKIAIFLKINRTVEAESIKLQSIYQIASLSIALLLIKALSYVGYIFEPVAIFQKIIGLVRDKLLPILVMVLTFLFSFSIFIFFYYGSHIPEFSDGLISIMIFLVNIINQYFYNVETMYKLSPTMTIIFVIFFIIFANFVFISIFLISSIHTFDDFMKKRHETVKKKEAKKTWPDAHMLWKAKDFIIKDLKLFYYMIFDRKKEAVFRVELDKEEKRVKRELLNYIDYPYDLSIEKNVKVANGNHRFRNEITNFKMAKAKKIGIVTLCWKIIGSFIMIFILIIISLEHQEIVEGRSMIRSADTSFDQISVIYINNEGRKVILKSSRTVDEIRSYPDFIDWLNLFQAFGQERVYSLSSGEELKGFFFGGVNYLLTDNYRITVRKASLIENDEPYSQLSQYTFTEAFMPLDIDPPGESTVPIVGKSTGRTYYYTREGSYMNAGGYVFYSTIDEIAKTFQEAVDDGVLDNAVMCYTIDFPIYQPTTSNVLYGRVLVVLDDSYNFNIETSIDLVALNFYMTSYQRFIAFLEICLVLSFCLLAYRLFWVLRNKINQYNLWYSLHIAFYPEIMIEARNRKEPEYLRKSKFMFKFNETTSFIFLILMWICSLIWITYLAVGKTVLSEVDKFMYNDPAADSVALFDQIVWALEISGASKFFEAMLVFVLSIKIIYYYSFFKQFQYVTRTLAKSVRNSFTLLIILFFYLLAFAMFLHINMSMKFDSYTSVIDIVCMLMQMISGLFARAHHELFLENDFKGLTLVFFYIPYIFIVIFLVSYMFLSVQMYFCNQSQEEMAAHDDLEVEIPLKEFVKLSFSLLNPKKKRAKLNFQISDQTIYDIRLHEIFADFRETIEMKEKFKQMEMWAYNCAKSIFNEYQKRKRVKKLNKEIMQAVMEHNLAEGEDLSKMNSVQRLHEDKLRLKYWDYFRVGNFTLREFMDEFNELNNVFEKMTSSRSFIKKKKQSEYKIKKYIIYLEKMYEKNMVQIKNLMHYIEKHNEKLAAEDPRRNIYRIDESETEFD